MNVRTPGDQRLDLFVQEKQKELKTIKKVIERLKGSDETDEVDEASPKHGGGARVMSIVSSLVSTSTKAPPAARSLADPVRNVPRFASRPATPSVMDSFMVPDGA